MAKLNSIGVRAKDIDRIIDGAIQRIETGEDVYSCCALITQGKRIDDWKVIKDKTGQEKKLIKKFNGLRNKEDSLIRVRGKLGISWPKTKKLEGYRMLDLGWKGKDIVKELGVNISTVSHWRALQKS